MITLTIIEDRVKQNIYLKAKRIDPLGSNIKNGTLCTYDLSIYNKKIGNIVCEYGNDIELGIEMLKKLKEHKE